MRGCVDGGNGVVFLRKLTLPMGFPEVKFLMFSRGEVLFIRRVLAAFGFITMELKAIPQNCI
jgi:hypothetical protein